LRIVSTGGPAVLAFEGVIPRDQFGRVAGAGAETFIGSSNWLARLEYLHYDFGTVEQTSGVSSTVPGAFQSVDRGGGAWGPARLRPKLYAPRRAYLP
jgi:hypothetical protein